MELIKTNKNKNKISGNIGESSAVKYLEEKGYEILETNYRNKIGEIDIIAKDNERIVFIEVKARSTARFGYPREAVTLKKQQTIKLVALSYLKRKRLINAYIRFDIIEILAGEITHLVSVF